jgi:hypothetical protein
MSLSYKGIRGSSSALGCSLPDAIRVMTKLAIRREGEAGATITFIDVAWTSFDSLDKRMSSLSYHAEERSLFLLQST